LNVSLPERRDVLSLPQVRAALREAEQQLGQRGRVLLRASGTEPLIRIMVEGSEKAEVDSLVQDLAAIVKMAVQHY